MVINTEAHYWPRCPKGNICSEPHSQSSGLTAEEGVERVWTPEAVDDYKNSLSSGHMGITARMNS